MLVSQRLKRLVKLVPGQRRFGFYRFLPFFFVLGGAMEWFMINVRFGEETFCECGVPGASPGRGSPSPQRGVSPAPVRAPWGTSGSASPAETHK